jgi:hypothetical protein
MLLKILASPSGNCYVHWIINIESQSPYLIAKFHFNFAIPKFEQKFPQDSERFRDSSGKCSILLKTRERVKGNFLE